MCHTGHPECVVLVMLGDLDAKERAETFALIRAARQPRHRRPGHEPDYQVLETDFSATSYINIVDLQKGEAGETPPYIQFKRGAQSQPKQRKGCQVQQRAGRPERRPRSLNKVAFRRRFRIIAAKTGASAGPGLALALCITGITKCFRSGQM